MKPKLPSIFIFVTILVVACAPLQASQPASVDMSTITPMTVPVVESTPQGSGMVVKVSTAIVTSINTPTAIAEGGTEVSSGSEPPTDGVTFAENGRTFAMTVGESFLLNLGTDQYDWTVEVDNQNVLRREMNVMPIRGVQGIYIAENPGTAVLTATGDPLCRQSKPACMRPSILFSITVIVE